MDRLTVFQIIMHISSLRKKKVVFFLIFCCCLFRSSGYAQSVDAAKPVAVTDLSGFKAVQGKWSVVGDVFFHPADPLKSTTSAGEGVILSTKSITQKQELFFKEIPADTAGRYTVEFEFMLSLGSSLMVHLPGEYVVIINDSWKKDSGAFAAIQKISGNKLVYKKIPSFDLRKATGLWQKISFRLENGPGTGKNRAAARLIEMKLNETVIHNDVLLPDNTDAVNAHPTSNAPSIECKGLVALKNIKANNLIEPSSGKKYFSRDPNDFNKSILLEPSNETIVQRCFFDHNDHKKTFCVVVGGPGHLHYALDLSQAALISVWRGGFIDATSMWHERGEVQLAMPTGSDISLPGGPSFSVLDNNNKDASWPDSLTAPAFRFNHYTLDEQRRPSFTYSYQTAVITQSIRPFDQTSFDVSYTIRESRENTPELSFRIAAGNTIQSIGDGLYSIDNHSYRIRLKNDGSVNATIRNTKNGQELIAVKYPASPSLDYRIIW